MKYDYALSPAPSALWRLTLVHIFVSVQFIVWLIATATSVQFLIPVALTVCVVLVLCTLPNFHVWS